MIRRNFKPLSCDLDGNGPDSIHRVVALAQLFSVTNGLTPTQRAKLAVLVEEAVTNLYDHGVVGDGFHGRVDLLVDGEDVHIRISDSGDAFDPRTAEDVAMPNADRGGGAGLAMIRAWADIVDYRSQAGMNLLELKLRG